MNNKLDSFESISFLSRLTFREFATSKRNITHYGKYLLRDKLCFNLFEQYGGPVHHNRHCLLTLKPFNPLKWRHGTRQ